MNPIPILLYHRVDTSGGPFATEPDVFSQHLAWLAGQGYRSLSADDLAEVVGGSSPVPEKGVMITFDDGFADLETAVAPVLEKHQFTATVFLITGRCPTTTSPDDEYLSWPSARRLADCGLMEFHSHTHGHQQWSAGSTDVGAVRDDLETSLTVLSDELRRPSTDFTHLAWPFGQTHPEWEDVAADLGLSTQYVVQRGAVNSRDRSVRLPRLMVDGFSSKAFNGWMTLLSTRGGAAATNQLFGTIRNIRRGAGYR